MTDAAAIARDELEALAVRCEAAEGPNYALECEIADTVWLHKWGRKRPKDIRAEPVTASLDAAITLVPELLAWHVSSACPRDACAAIESGDDRVQDFKGRALTPAPALAAAALRAIKGQS